MDLHDLIAADFALCGFPSRNGWRAIFDHRLPMLAFEREGRKPSGASAHRLLSPGGWYTTRRCYILVESEGGDLAQPKAVELQPDGIHIQWDDGHQGYYPYRYLRAECRCAGCVHEMSGRRMVGLKDIPEDVEALDWMIVGRYALQFLWSDAHDTGIYTYDMLREACRCELCSSAKE